VVEVAAMIRAMTRAEQNQQREAEKVMRQVIGALRLLTLLGDTSEDVAVALARCENWQTENEGRWVR